MAMFRILNLPPLAPGEESPWASLVDLERIGDPDRLAAQWLTAAEREQYAGLRHPLRRGEWVGARAALKHLLLEARRDRRARPG